MRTRVFLNPSDTSLAGKYPADAEHIHIVCDSSVAPFTVVLPDLFLPEHKEFIFYNVPDNVPDNGMGNDVTITPISGQVMNYDTTSHVLSAYDSLTLVSDLKKRWLLSDIKH